MVLLRLDLPVSISVSGVSQVEVGRRCFGWRDSRAVLGCQNLVEMYQIPVWSCEKRTKYINIYIYSPGSRVGVKRREGGVLRRDELEEGGTHQTRVIPHKNKCLVEKKYTRLGDRRGLLVLVSWAD